MANVTTASCSPSPRTHTKHPGTRSGYLAVYRKGWVLVPAKQQIYSPPASIYPREKRHIAQEGHEGFLGAWKELVIAAHPCKGAPRLSPSEIRGTRRVEGVWQLPKQERKSPSESSGILSHRCKKQAKRGGRARSLRVRGKPRGHRRHLLPQNEPCRLDRRWAAQRAPGLFPRQESRRDVVFGGGQEKCPRGCVSWEQCGASMGQSPRKEPCVPANAVPRGWAGLTDAIHPKKDLVLVFSGTKSGLCRRKGEVWGLHDTFPAWCIPRLQLGWVLGRDFGPPSQLGPPKGCDSVRFCSFTPPELLIYFSSTTWLVEHLHFAEELVIFVEVKLLSPCFQRCRTVDVSPSSCRVSQHHLHQHLLLAGAK